MKTTPCPLCGSEKQITLRDTLRYDIKRNVQRCSECDFVFLEDKDDSNGYYSSETYRSKYGPNLRKSSNPEEIFNAYYPHQGPIINEIKQLLNPSMSVLDVGCSAGQFLASLKGLAGTRVGLELSQNEVDFIKSHHDFTAVYNEPIESVKIKEGPFDLVTSLQVVEHVPNPISFVKNLAKQVKPGGYLYLELPNLNDALLDCYELSGYADFYFREPHVSYFTPKTFKHLLDAAGLKGEIKTVQRYNIINHLSWIITNRPQEDFSMGNGTPQLVKSERAPADVKVALNDFFAKMDSEYKSLLQKYGLGESLTFLAKID